MKETACTSMANAKCVCLTSYCISFLSVEVWWGDSYVFPSMQEEKQGSTARAVAKIFQVSFSRCLWHHTCIFHAVLVCGILHIHVCFMNKVMHCITLLNLFFTGHVQESGWTAKRMRYGFLLRKRVLVENVLSFVNSVTRVLFCLFSNQLTLSEQTCSV